MVYLMVKTSILLGLILALCIVFPTAAMVSDETVTAAGGEGVDPISVTQLTMGERSGKGMISISSAGSWTTGTIDLVVGGGNPRSAMDCGDVSFSYDCGTGKLYVTFDIVDQTPSDPFDNWYLTETHVAVASDPADIPQANRIPVPGRFPKEDSATFDPATGTITYTEEVDISGFPCGEPLYIAAHAVVKDPCGLQGLELALPVTVQVIISSGDSNGSPSYLDAQVTDPTGVLTNSALDVWCVDIGRWISKGPSYDMTVYSSYEVLPAGTVDKPWNLDLINWVINNIIIGQHLYAADGVTDLGIITAGDIQRAIWFLIDDTPDWNPAWPYSDDRVDRIVALAHANGEGFTPLCGQKVAILFAAKDVQTIMGGLRIPCDTCRSGTGWAALVSGTVTDRKGNVVPVFSYPFGGKNWATYIEIPGCDC
jgi:hypothetical protein